MVVQTGHVVRTVLTSLVTASSGVERLAWSVRAGERRLRVAIHLTRCQCCQVTLGRSDTWSDRR